MYPSKYKVLLKMLSTGVNIPIADVVYLFPVLREEIEGNRHRVDVTDEVYPEYFRMDYKAARKIVSDTVEHYGFIEVDGELHDSIDDCADILVELDEVEKFESFQKPSDVWWKYVFFYDSHINDHMKNLEAQNRCLTNQMMRTFNPNDS